MNRDSLIAVQGVQSVWWEVHFQSRLSGFHLLSLNFHSVPNGSLTITHNVSPLTATLSSFTAKWIKFAPTLACTHTNLIATMARQQHLHQHRGRFFSSALWKLGQTRLFTANQCLWMCFGFGTLYLSVPLWWILLYSYCRPRPNPRGKCFSLSFWGYNVGARIENQLT